MVIRVWTWVVTCRAIPGIRMVFRCSASPVKMAAALPSLNCGWSPVADKVTGLVKRPSASVSAYATQYSSFSRQMRAPGTPWSTPSASVETRRPVYVTVGWSTSRDVGVTENSLNRVGARVSAVAGTWAAARTRPAVRTAPRALNTRVSKGKGAKSLR